MIVAIGSTMRVGKSTAAQGLVRDLGFVEVSFADRVRELAMLCDPLINANAVTNVGIGSGHLAKLVKSVGGWERGKDTFPEVRRFLQNLGQGCRQVLGEDVWVNLALRNAPERAVVPDLRYRNEFDAVKAKGGKCIRIDRPGFSGSGHVSETELADVPDDEWDGIVLNDLGILDLQTTVVETVRPWLRDHAA